MSTSSTPNPEPNLIDDDTHYEVVPRRCSERRSGNQSQDLAYETTILNYKKGIQGTLISREGERRQSDRRTSRPTLLSVDEIAVLRKK